MASDPVPSELRGFSVRLPRPLWIGVAAFVLLVGGVGLQIGLPIYRQHVAIRAIERLGGAVETRELRPSWLRRLVGGEWARGCEEAVAVSLSSTQWTDVDMVHLEPMAGLQRLHLNSTRISDAGLASLRKFKMLQELDLANTRVTDLGIHNIEELPRLRKLYLHGTIVSKTWIADATRKQPGLVVYANGPVYANGLVY